MKFKALKVLLCLSALFMSPVFAVTAMSTGNSHHFTNASLKKDAEIIALLITLNKNEIAASKETLTKSVDPLEKNFARTMIKDHSKNLQDTINLSHKIHITPYNTQAVAALKKEGAEEMKTLMPLKGKDYQTAYGNAMVKDHTEALDLLDNNLLKNVHNPMLKKHLEATRNKVSQHLAAAKDMQSKLASSN